MHSHLALACVFCLFVIGLHFALLCSLCSAAVTLVDSCATSTLVMSESLQNLSRQGWHLGLVVSDMACFAATAGVDYVKNVQLPGSTMTMRGEDVVIEDSYFMGLQSFGAAAIVFAASNVTFLNATFHMNNNSAGNTASRVSDSHASLDTRLKVKTQQACPSSCTTIWI